MHLILEILKHIPFFWHFSITGSLRYVLYIKRKNERPEIILKYFKKRNRNEIKTIFIAVIFKKYAFKTYKH